MTSIFVKRPVAFRIPRVIDDKISETEFRYFTDEHTAFTEADAIGIDYQALFVRDGTAVVQTRDQVAAEVIEQCAQVLDKLAAEQDATNQKHPDHAKAYATWVDRVFQWRWSAQAIRALAVSRPQEKTP